MSERNPAPAIRSSLLKGDAEVRVPRSVVEGFARVRTWVRVIGTVLWLIVGGISISLLSTAASVAILLLNDPDSGINASVGTAAVAGLVFAVLCAILAQRLLRYGWSIRRLVMTRAAADLTAVLDDQRAVRRLSALSALLGVALFAVAFAFLN